MKKPYLSLVALAVVSALLAPAVNAAEVSLGSATWTKTREAGIISGDVAVPTNAATGNAQFGYVTTAGGVTGVSPLLLNDSGKGSGQQTNGTNIQSSSFSALAGDSMTLYFNYISTDGKGFDDYAWARLVTDGTNDTAAWLFTARSNTSDRGNVVPGGVLKDQTDGSLPDKVDAVLNDGNSIGFETSGTVWAPLGSSSGLCWNGSNACGPTGWIKSAYSFTNGGSYFLEFGVSNWGDEAWDSALAFDFVGLQASNFSGVTVVPPLTPVPEPETYAMLLAGLGLLGFAARRRKQKEAAPA